MAAISSLQIGGSTYDIYAKSAAQVGAHELSSHSHFSTYFNGTSANYALTSKSALSAGSASKAVSASGANSASFALSSNTARNGNFFEDSLGGVPATFNSASTYAAGTQVYTGGYIYSAKVATTAGVWSAASGQFARLSQVNWTITDTSITGLYKGLQLWVKIPSYGGSSGSNATMLNINGSGAKQIRYNNGNYTTHYGAGTIIHMTYDGNYFQIGDRTDGNDRVGQYSATDNASLPIILKRTTGGQETQTVKYASAFTYNPNTNVLSSTNIKCANITATGSDGNVGITVGDSTQASTAYITPSVISMDEGGYAGFKFDSLNASANDNGSDASCPWTALLSMPGNYSSNSGKVAQKEYTADGNFPLILKWSANSTDQTANVKYDRELKYNPSSNTLYNIGKSASIINGNDNTYAFPSAHYVIVNGYNNSATRFQYASNSWTRPTSGVIIAGNNNKCCGLKNGAVIGDNLVATGSNGSPIQNVVFLGNYNSTNNLNIYKTAKVVIGEQKGNNAGTSSRADIFAIKGGGTIWSNAFDRERTDHYISLNGFYDSKTNYATLNCPVPTSHSSYSSKSAYFLNYYSTSDSYLIASLNGFLRPTDIKIKKVTDGYFDYVTGTAPNTGTVHNNVVGGLSVVSITAGDYTPGSAYIGYVAPGFLQVGTNAPGTANIGVGAPGTLCVGDGAPGTAYFGNHYSYAKINYGGIDGSDWIRTTDGQYDGSIYIQSYVVNTNVKYSIGSTKNNSTKSGGVCYCDLGNSYANLSLASQTHYPYASLSSNGNMPMTHINVSLSGGSQINISTALFGTTGSPKVTAGVNIGNFSNQAGYNFTYLKLAGKLSAIQGNFFDNNGNSVEIHPQAITLDEGGYMGFRLDSQYVSANDNGDSAKCTWLNLLSVPSYFNGSSAKSALTSKSALSAGTAGSSKWTSGSDNILRPISFANSNASAAWNGGSAFNSDQVYSKYFLFNPTNNVLQVGNTTTDRSNQGGIYTNYVNSLNIEAGKIQGTQVYFSDDKNYVGSEIVQIGGVGVKSTTATYSYKPQLRLDFGTACPHDSTFSSDAPKILFLGGNSTTAYNVSAALAFSYYNTPSRFGSSANMQSIGGGWFDFSLRDGGDAKAGVLADCFSATSGLYNYIKTPHTTITSDEVLVTASNYRIKSNFWNGYAQTHALDFFDWFSQTALYENWSTSNTGSPDGLLRTGKIKTVRFNNSASQSAKLSVQYTLNLWKGGHTIHFRSYATPGNSKHLVLTDIDKPIKLYKSDTNSVTTINTGTTFTIAYNGTNASVAGFWSTTAAGIDLSIHVNSVSNFTEYYMFIDKCPTN